MIRIPGILKPQKGLPLLIFNLNRICNIRYLLQLSFIPRNICKIKLFAKFNLYR